MLRDNNCLQLRNILKLMYDKNLEFLIPNTPPPYTPSDLPESQGLLYREARKLKHFVKGYSGNLSQHKREMLFIEMLEMVDRQDALLLCDMIAQTPIKGLTISTINTAFEMELIADA